MKTEVVRITPSKASELLKNNVGNRKLSKSHVRFLSGEMVKGNWKFDGQPIRLTSSGRVLDGQHRLNAIIQSKTSQDFLIVEGIEIDAFKVMDTGKGRSAADILGIKGFKYSAYLSQAIKSILAHKRGSNNAKGGEKRSSNTDVLNFMEGNADYLQELAEESSKLYTKFNKVLKLSDLIFYKYLTDKKNYADSERFWNEVCLGIDLKENSATRRFRDFLIKDRVSKSSLPSRERKAVFVKAWNAYRLNKPVKFLRWNKEKETFPSLV
jgi:hypothetical protein